MKVLGLIAMAAALAATALFLSLANRAAEPVAASAPERPLVFVPGLLGSRLCRTAADGTETVAWGTVDALSQFPTLAVTPDDGLKPCGLIREISYLGIFTQTLYGPFIDRLKSAGYEEGRSLFVFDYDWRHSVLDNAQRLAEFVKSELPEGRFDIVGHSMGGLVARTYALGETGEPRISRLISAGSPFRGSVQVFELLKNGFGLANPLFGGIEQFRRTVSSFPSTFELMPSYAGCCDLTPFLADDATAWDSLNWTGIDRDRLPDLATIASHQAELSHLADAPLPAGIEEALVIGVDQRTPQQFEIATGEGEAQLTVVTSWEGDGTVLRDSSAITDRVIYPTSFATHDAILNDGPVQDFVLAALADGPRAAAAEVPVRPRTDLLTALGEMVELIGVAVTTDEPVYRTGTKARLTVHMRLATQSPVDAASIELSVTRPGHPAEPLTLASDPAASDPTNPFEQSFSAEIPTGPEAGMLTVVATLKDTGDAPRIVTRSVPVL